MVKTNSLIILTIILTSSTLPYLMYVDIQAHVEENLLSSLQDQLPNQLGTATIILQDQERNPLSAPFRISASSLDFMLGAGVWTTTAITSWTTSDWDYYRNASFEYEQIWTTWRLIQPTPNQFDYSSIQGQIDYVKSHNPNAKFFARLQGIVPDPLVGNSLNDSTPPEFTNFTASTPPDFTTYLSQVSRYVLTLVSKYKGQIDVWVTPIEINRIDYATSAFNLPTSPWTLQEAVEIDRIVAAAIKEANPNAIIVLGTSTPLSPYEGSSENRVDPITFEKMAIAGGVRFDDVAIEVYAFNGDVSFWYRYLNEMSNLGKPIFINEAGASSDQFDYAKLEPGREAQGAWCTALLTLSLSMHSIAGFFFLEFKDRIVQARYSQFETMGLIDANGEPKPSYGGIQQILQGLTEYNGTTMLNGHVTVRLLPGNYTFQADGRKGELRIVEGTNLTYSVRVGNETELQFTTSASAPTIATGRVENDPLLGDGDPNHVWNVLAFRWPHDNRWS